MKKIILSIAGFIFYAFTSQAYAITDKELYRNLYESINKKNQGQEVYKLIARKSTNWPNSQPSSASSAEFSWFDEKFNIYLWRDGSNNIWVKVEPIGSKAFICGGSFDVFQNGTFRLDDDGSSIVKLESQDGTSICEDVLGASIYKLTVWSFLSDRADFTKPFELFYNGDASEDREFSINFNTNIATDDNLNKSNILFDFAEKNYPQFFSPSGMETFKIQGYLARYYSNSDTYIGTLGEDVYVYGNVFNGLLYVGKIGDFIQESSASDNTLIINVDGIELVNPYTIITDSGSIHIPYIVRESNGSPSRGYGVSYISNDGKRWESFFSPLTGQLQSAKFTDEQGTVNIKFKNYNENLKQVDITVEYENGETESVQGVSLDLFLDSMTSYRKQAKSIKEIEQELDDFRGWIKEFVREHVEKATGWADKIGGFFDKFKPRINKFLDKTREESSKIANNIARRITCENDECVENEVKNNPYIDDSSFESYDDVINISEEICDDGIDNDENGLIDENCAYNIEVYVEDNKCKDDVIGVKVDGVNLGNTPMGKGRHYNISSLSTGQHELTLVGVKSGGSQYGCAPGGVISYSMTITGYQSDSGEFQEGTNISYTFEL